VSEIDNKRLMQSVLSEMSKGNREPFIDAMAEDMRWTWMATGRWSHTFEGKDAEVNEPLAAVKETLVESSEAIPPYFHRGGRARGHRAQRTDHHARWTAVPQQVLLGVPVHRRQAA
jgi:ketosteroid isomerase-like protein